MRIATVVLALVVVFGWVIPGIIDYQTVWDSLKSLTLLDVVGALRAGHCHRRGWTGRGIRVVMTDSGFAPHPYFERQGYNITRAHTPETEHPMIDGSGHGTW